MLIPRKLEKKLITLAGQYPVVTLSGPRQSGKTTLAKMVFPSYSYANLEDPDTRLLAQNDINGFFQRFAPPVIVDEIQREPRLISKIQVLSDEMGKDGMFILTGSQQLALKETISQSLAGRTAVLTVLPLSIEEITSAGLSDSSRDEFLVRGFFPRLYQRTDVGTLDFYRSYTATYLERDLSQMATIQDLSLFQNFLKLLAGRVGQLINYSSLGADVGVSHTTLMNWFNLLEASFLIQRIHSWYPNRTKSVVKTPKCYFTDVGLAAYLLGIKTPEQMDRDPLRGNLFENMVVMEAVKGHLNNGRSPDIFFFRNSRGVEVDMLIAKERNSFIPCEIKSSSSFSPDFGMNIRAFSTFPDIETVNPTIIYNGETSPFKDMNFLNFRKTHLLCD